MQKKHFLAIDFLRVSAILAVILIHTTTKTIQIANNALEQIPFTLLLNQFAIFAVPLFFLISGFVLNAQSGEMSYLQFFKKRLSRIIVPYLFWSLFYFIVFPFAHDQHESLVYLILTGNASYQLYFIPSIIIFYLFFPVLHFMQAFLAKWYILLFLFAIQFYLLYQDYYIKQYDIESAFRVVLMTFIFFPLGMVARVYEEQLLMFIKKYYVILFILFPLIFLYTYAETIQLFEKTKSIHYFYSQYHPSVLPYTLVFTGIVFFFFSKTEPAKKIIMLLSKLSFFVFFIHVAILYYLWSFFGTYLYTVTRTTQLGKISFDMIFFLGVSTISFLIAYVVHKIPFVNKITG